MVSVQDQAPTMVAGTGESLAADGAGAAAATGAAPASLPPEPGPAPAAENGGPDAAPAGGEPNVLVAVARGIPANGYPRRAGPLPGSIEIAPYAPDSLTIAGGDAHRASPPGHGVPERLHKAMTNGPDGGLQASSVGSTGAVLVALVCGLLLIASLLHGRLLLAAQHWQSIFFLALPERPG